MRDDTLLLRIPEVARRLGLSRLIVYQHVMTGSIPSVRIGRARRVPADALTAWVADRVAEQTQADGVPVGTTRP